MIYIDDLIQQQVAVLLINPVDSASVSSAIIAANKAGIPVITLDRSADKGQVVTLIAADNVAGGKMAAEFIIAKLGDQVKVAELEGILGASATRERGRGFDELAQRQLQVVAKQSADFDRAKGLSVAENIIQAHGDIQAIFAQNDEMALGAVEAVKSSAKNILVIGFDGSSDGIKAVKSGQLTATVAQQPELIGKVAVETAKKIILKEPVAAKIAVPLKMVAGQ